MAKLDSMPHRSIIDGFKGLLDIYYWKGLAVARRWPRKPHMPRSPASHASATAFANLSRRLSATHPTVKAFARRTARGSPWTWKDLLTSAQYGHVFTWTP